jgi:hypothetical protein
MSDASQDNSSESGSGGILAALPRARPQRASPRRAAAKAAAKKPKNTPKAATKKLESAPKRRAKASRPVPIRGEATRTRARNEPRAPKQGYEPEDEVELGVTVNPPSGTELVESVADIVGELAGAGLTAGGRLLKDAFSLLRRP